MFELETAIADWRKSLLITGTLSEDAANELECHLRENVERLKGGELSESEAFVIATMRLGSPDQLGAEYQKVYGGNLASKRLVWMAGGYVGGIVVTGLINGAAAIIAAMTMLAGFPAIVAGVVAIVVMAIGWSILFKYLTGADSSWLAWRHPMMLAGVLVIGAIVGNAMGLGGNVIQSRIMPMSEMGVLMLWQTYGSILFQVVISIVCLYVITLNGKNQEPAST